MKIEFIKSTKDRKIELVERLVDKLDDLYDDLTYDNDEKELACINRKIKLREETIKQLLQK